jgi:hypothetical protein
MIPSRIKLVNQDDNVSCVLAGVAMVTGVSLSMIRERCKILNIWPPLNTFDQCRLLVFCGIFPVMQNIDCESLIEGNVYAVTVPSLNTKGHGLHSIIVDTRNEGDIQIFDPQNGIEGKDFYTEDALKCYSTVLKLIDPVVGQ